MSDVANAWDEYLQTAERRDLSITEVFTRSESEDSVRAAFAEAGLEAHDDIVGFYTVLGAIKVDHTLSIFRNHQMLDLGKSIAHHTELLRFAAENADDGDPDDLYAPSWHPIASGKPTTMVDRIDGVVVERWWDEIDVREVTSDLAAWIRSQAEALETADDLDQFRARVNGEAHIYFDAFSMKWSDYWLSNATTSTELHRCSQVVIQSAPPGHAEHSCGLEEVQAQLVADLLVANGFPADQISFNWEPIGDGRFSHTVFVKGYR